MSLFKDFHKFDEFVGRKFVCEYTNKTYTLDEDDVKWGIQNFISRAIYEFLKKDVYEDSSMLFNNIACTDLYGYMDDSIRAIQTIVEVTFFNSDDMDIVLEKLYEAISNVKVKDVNELYNALVSESSEDLYFLLCPPLSDDERIMDEIFAIFNTNKSLIKAKSSSLQIYELSVESFKSTYKN